MAAKAPHGVRALTAVLALTMALAVPMRMAAAQAPPAKAITGEVQAFLATRAKKLDALFQALQAAATRTEAQEITAEIWRQWTQSGRDDVDTLMLQAAAAMSTRNYGLATLLLDEVVDEAPDFSEGWNRRATLRYTMGDHAGSLADIDKTLALEPRHFGALAGQGLIHRTAGRWKEALASYRAALPYYRFNADMITLVRDLEKQVEGQKL
ncbi:MAG: tetratricopeptide repeat protein [Hyphomicrobiaceae bacterium]